MEKQIKYLTREINQQKRKKIEKDFNPPSVQESIPSHQIHSFTSTSRLYCANSFVPATIIGTIESTL